MIAILYDRVTTSVPETACCYFCPLGCNLQLQMKKVRVFARRQDHMITGYVCCVSYCLQNQYGLRFDDPSWQCYINSLKPLVSSRIQVILALC